MATRHALHRGPRQHDLLHRLIQARTELAPEDYTLFFVTEEGRVLPNSRPGDDVEEMSGYVLAHAGDIYFFWFGWDVGTQQPALTEWRPADPAPHWRHSAEYRRARERLQLSRT